MSEPIDTTTVSAEEILEGTEKLLAAFAAERPEVAIACCVLLAFAMIRDRPMGGAEAQDILDRFTTFALSDAGSAASPRLN